MIREILDFLKANNYSELGFFAVLTRNDTKNHSTRQGPNTKHHTSDENQAMDMEVLIRVESTIYTVYGQ